MNPSTDTPREAEEVDLFDLFEFFWSNWLIILGGAILGAAAAIAYANRQAPVYEARMQVQMAQVRDLDAPQAGGNAVEGIDLLIERLRVPTTYTEETARKCGIGSTDFPLETLTQAVEARPLRNVASVAAITVRAKSPEVARSCAVAVFEMIRNQQNGLMSLRLDVARERILSLSARLEEVQTFLHKMEKTNLQSAVYLARRDELLWLRDQIATLERSLRLSTETKLVSPVYSPPSPSGRGNATIILAGVLVGLMFGIIVAAARKFILMWRIRQSK